MPQQSFQIRKIPLAIFGCGKMDSERWRPLVHSKRCFGRKSKNWPYDMIMFIKGLTWGLGSCGLVHDHMGDQRSGWGWTTCPQQNILYREEACMAPNWWLQINAMKFLVDGFLVNKINMERIRLMGIFTMHLVLISKGGHAWEISHEYFGIKYGGGKGSSNNHAIFLLV